jgi:hypothetical protein
MAILNLVPNKGADLIKKSLKSAVQVAKDNNLDPATLVIQRVWCDEGLAMKRLIGHSRGRMSRIMKKHSHLSLVLAGTELTRTRRKVSAKPASTEESAAEVATPEVTAEKGEK